jgi:hypothetical protein
MNQNKSFRQEQAARLAAQLGLNAAGLYAAASAIWSNLNPQSASFDQALSLAAAAQLAANAGKGERTYTREEISAAFNAGANLAQEHEYEDTDTIRMDDAVNLAVNAGLYLLDHPGATLDEIIPASYAEVELDMDDFEDFDPNNEPTPVMGTPRWNAALVRKVKGWLA